MKKAMLFLILPFPEQKLPRFYIHNDFRRKSYIKEPQRKCRRKTFPRVIYRRFGKEDLGKRESYSWILMLRRQVLLAYIKIIIKYTKLPLIKFRGKVLQYERHKDTRKLYHDKKHAVKHNGSRLIKDIWYFKLQRYRLDETKVHSDSWKTGEKKEPKPKPIFLVLTFLLLFLLVINWLWRYIHGILANLILTKPSRCHNFLIFSWWLKVCILILLILKGMFIEIILVLKCGSTA